MKNPKVTYENGSTYIQMPGKHGDLIRVEGEATVWLHHPVEGDSENELLLGDANPGGFRRSPPWPTSPERFVD